MIKNIVLKSVAILINVFLVLVVGALCGAAAFLVFAMLVMPVTTGLNTSILPYCVYAGILIAGIAFVFFDNIDWS